MTFFDWLDSNIQKMRWYDISFLKLAVFFATLFLITVWPAFRTFVLGFAWYWYLALMTIFMIPLLKKMFSR
ncbi:TPA: hypothetical protein HA295_03715 [Candidatus Woesearchaeota archaeon]|nr:hypothetical protein [Candidatus Woesearchaeota archaeon]HII65855.1 hypothetical protein [Candidatus Woesearchaeota archaeon]